MNLNEMDLNTVMEQIGKEKNIDKTVLIEILELAMLNAAKKNLGLERDLEAKYNEDSNEVEVYEFKQIVAGEVTLPTEISFDDALKLDAELTQDDVGEDLGIKLDSKEFGRIAAQNAKQIIIQRLRDAERNMVFDEYKDRKGELVTGVVRRFERNAIIVDLGRAEGVLSSREQIAKENIRVGERIVAFVVDVLDESKGHQILLSRTNPGLVLKLFEQEVPEINEGIIEINSVSRDAGSRSKISVASKDSDIDPVGSCVGMKGTRVQAVVQELKGEKIDIVPYSSDPARFVCNALAPAEAVRVLVNEGNHAMQIVVPDDQLSLAIGRRGQNVRLAAELTGWKIDIISETKSLQEKELAWESLSKVDGLNDITIQNLYNHGFRNAKDLLSAEKEFLLSLPGMDDKLVDSLNKNAQKAVDVEEKSHEIQKELAIKQARELIVIEKGISNSDSDDSCSLEELSSINDDDKLKLLQAKYENALDLYYELDINRASRATSLPVEKIMEIRLEASNKLNAISDNKIKILPELTISQIKTLDEYKASLNNTINENK